MFIFFFNDTATTEIYTLSLHDALPISRRPPRCGATCRKRLRRSAKGWCRSTSSTPHFTSWRRRKVWCRTRRYTPALRASARSEEHTSELQSLAYLVCRLLLEKKKNNHE